LRGRGREAPFVAWDAAYPIYLEYTYLMMKSYYLLFTILLIGCSGKKISTVTVEMYSHFTLKETFEVSMIESEKSKVRSIIFSSNLVDTIYSFILNKTDLSTIEFCGYTSPLIDKKIYDIRDNKVEVLKYRYDEASSYDEELDIYVTSTGDILGLRELAWEGYLMFTRPSHTEIINALPQDTTRFFKFNFRFMHL
jgi:hypothetical protein